MERVKTARRESGDGGRVRGLCAEAQLILTARRPPAALRLALDRGMGISGDMSLA
jgi:hypothetical protein